MIGIRKNEADLVTDWIENHCVVPIGADKDKRVRLTARMAT
jgi:hypothetical protein